jgi:hypothetical protein
MNNISNSAILENSENSEKTPENIYYPPVKAIVFPHINGDFVKFAEMFQKIRDKSGSFDLVFLTGNVFNPAKDFALVKELEILSTTTKFLIFDSSEVGIVCKHNIGYSHQHLSENITILGRSGFYNINGLKVAYLNGRENKKYLSEDEKYKYTSGFFSRDDVDFLTSKKMEMKTDILLINSIPSLILDEMVK